MDNDHQWLDELHMYNWSISNIQLEQSVEKKKKKIILENNFSDEELFIMEEKRDRLFYLFDGLIPQEFLACLQRKL